jgi:formate hydrogenlyase subunit 4
VSWLWEGAALVALLVVSPLTVWSERRVKAWTQLRQGPSWRQPYRDLRRFWAKEAVAPSTASAFYRIAPWIGLACLLAAMLLLPLFDAAAREATPGLLILALFLTLQRVVLAAQAYDTGTAFGGIGASRELFLGGLGEPVLLLIAAAVYLVTGSAGIPTAPLPVDRPATWLIVGALVFAWLAEAARIPFDNPATHLELTMVHEAQILEASGWMLATQESLGTIKQTILAVLVLLFVVPLPGAGAVRVLLLLVGVVALSGLLALFESAVAKVRLFRASHLLVMGALLAFLSGLVTYLSLEAA